MLLSIKPQRFFNQFPVFCKCPKSANGQYQATGIYLVRSHHHHKVSPTFNWNYCIGIDVVSPAQNPADIINTLFEDNYYAIDEEFIIQ